MKLRKAVMVNMCIVLCFFLACTRVDVKEGQDAEEAKMAGEEDAILTVLNPLGTPPPIKLNAMAPRLDTLEGKTIYVDNNGYPGTSILLPELIAVMKEKFPDTKFIYSDKPAGSMMPAQDEAVGEADALIVATGH